MADFIDQRSWEECEKDLLSIIPLRIRIESLTLEERLAGLTPQQLAELAESLSKVVPQQTAD